MKWGTRYPADYVNRLYSMIQRNTTAPFRVVCLTDDKAGVRSEVECFDCPTINVNSKQQNGGWRKVSLWANQVPGLTGTALFLDLDVVIVDSLDPFFEVEGDYCVMRNWTQPNKRIGNTSIFRFEVGSHPYLLEQLEADPQAIFSTYGNSQSFISDRVQNMTFFPDPWCLLFKVHCLPPMPARLFRAPYLPEGARVVAFPGHPDPHEAAEGSWPGPWYKRLYKTVRPTPWILENWR